MAPQRLNLSILAHYLFPVGMFRWLLGISKKYLGEEIKNKCIENFNELKIKYI